MSNTEYDVIIIGAGMGGLITGAILAREAGMKVLVLEKEVQTGGRTISFGRHHPQPNAKEYRERLARCASLSIVDSSHSLEEIIDEKKIFKNHILDGGWHGASSNDRSRFAVLARSLGERLEMAPQIGFLFWDHDKGDWSELAEMTKNWSAQSARDRSRIAFERATISNDEAREKYAHVSVREYLESLTDDQKILDYYLTMAKFQSGINDVERISAGEWIVVNNMTAAAGRHLTKGGGMGDVSGGFRMISVTFQNALEKAGGELWLNSKVEELIIKDHKAVGVVAEINGERRDIYAKNIISNIPMFQAHKVIPEELWPWEFNERIKNIKSMPGILGHVKLKRPVEPTRNPKGMFVIDHLPGIKLRGQGGKPEEPVYGFEQTSIIDPPRLDGDGVILQTWVGVSDKDPDEVNNRELMKKLSDTKFDFMRQVYPDWDDNVEWMIMVKGTVYGINPGPGEVYDRYLPHTHPTIGNLFFTGDTVYMNDYGTNGATHSAVLAAGAVTGVDYLSRLLPPMLR